MFAFLSGVHTASRGFNVLACLKNALAPAADLISRSNVLELCALLSRNKGTDSFLEFSFALSSILLKHEAVTNSTITLKIVSLKLGGIR